MKQIIKLSAAMIMIMVVAVSISCKKEEVKDPMAGFTYAVDANDFLKVAFTNASENFETVSWDFGDGSAVSSEENPVHTFAAVGVYNVALTAKNGDKTDTWVEQVTIADPNLLLTMLAGSGTEGKTWKLIRDVSTGRYPMEVGPWDRSSIWWAQGKGNDELANRPCLLNDEWTFKRDGSMIYDAKGDYWKEGGWFAAPDNTCGSTSEPMVGPNGEDLTTWGNGSHQFRIYPGNEPKLTALGKGAFIGHLKLGNGVETKVPGDSVRYDLIKLTDDATDTLVIEGHYQWDASDGGYWRYVLVHYDDPNQEPPIPGNKPNVSFTVDVNGLTITCNNTTTGFDSQSWDFGDGTTSTETSPTHTYAAGGPYLVKYTATNAFGESVGSTSVFVTINELTDAALQGGAWKCIVADYTIFVGGGMGASNWWSVPKAFMDGSTTGGDDWSCIADDEFIFSAGGVYEYKTNGYARNDGWWGDPHGCISDADIAASANYGPAFGSGIHSYTFTPASGGNRAIIELTNGASGAAFLGFVKGFYGGENTNSANPPNGGNLTNKYEVMGYANTGTKEYLFVTTDISGAHDGSASWSTILQR